MKDLDKMAENSDLRLQFEIKRALLEDTPSPNTNEAFQEFLEKNGLKKRKSRRALWMSITSLAAAASIALLLMLSPWKSFNHNSSLLERKANQELSHLGNVIYQAGNEGKYISISMGDESINFHEQDKAKNVGVFITQDHVIQVLDMKGQASQDKDLTISVPSGQTAKVALPDGSKVQLNACSSLTFPHHFSENGAREVALQGEAYFEVNHDEAHPFLVHAHEFNVRVLGTQFNVRSYPAETHSVTLSEGIVRVEQGNQQIYLKTPAEAAVIQHNKLTHTIADMDQALSWMHGEFYFDGQDLREIMAEIGRWYHYNVVFAYANKHAEPLHFSADRTAPIKEIIQQLQMIGNAKIELREKEQVLLVK